MIKLIFSIVVLVLVTIFCGLNSGPESCCDINLFVYTFHQVPVFITVLVSLAAGVILVLPFLFSGKKKSSGDENSGKDYGKKDISGSDQNLSDGDKTIFDFKIRKSADKKGKNK